MNYINELQQVLQSLEAKKQRKIYTEVLSPRLGGAVSSPRPSPPVLSPRKPPLSPRLSLPISPRTPQPGSPYKPRLQQSYLNSPTAMAAGSVVLEPSPTSSSTASSNVINDNVNELSANLKSAVADVEVKFSGSNVLLKTVSPRIPGQAAKIIAALEDLSLEILNVSITTVDETMLNSFTIKVINLLILCFFFCFNDMLYCLAYSYLLHIFIIIILLVIHPSLRLIHPLELNFFLIF